MVLKYTQKEKKKSQVVYELKKRNKADANNEEWFKMYKQVEANHDKLRQTPDDTKPMLAIANIFIQEARITGNYTYYDEAAMKYVNDVLKKDPKNFEASLLKSLLFLSQHHFNEGLEMAQQAQKINPYNAFVYGVLVDGNVEMGNYDSAVVNSDRMVSIRPDIRSYSRIAYLREIYGDFPGAIEAMKMAVSAGAPGDETTGWARVQLGRLYENTGNEKAAEMEYEKALQERPGYAYALAGLGRLAMHTARYDSSAKYYMEAIENINDYSFKEELAEVYSFSGDIKKSEQMKKEVIENLSNDARKGEEDEDIGHYADRELAYAYVSTGDHEKALEHAIKEYNRRPGNIDVNETIAWVLYKKGESGKALTYLNTAMKTNSRNPTLLCRAGLIYFKTGDTAKARQFLKQALQENPVISPMLRKECSMVMQSL